MQGRNYFFKKFLFKEVLLKRKINIENLILKNYEPEFFSVTDVSEQHRGHKNFREDIESHFEIIIVSEKFKNLNRIERHRMVNQSLKEEFLSDLHSVTIKTYTTQEYTLSWYYECSPDGSTVTKTYCGDTTNCDCNITKSKNI